MKKVPMILLLIVPYATLIICYQANLDITVGVCVYDSVAPKNDFEPCLWLRSQWKCMAIKKLSWMEVGC